MMLNETIQSNKLLPLLIFLLSVVLVNAQTGHSYSTFKGEIIDIPLRTKNKEFGPHYDDFPRLGELEWEKINVPERYIDEGFPDVSKTQMFAIDFKSTIHITQEGCYEFSLKSDDGSLLWINDNLILNNTGDNQRIGTIDTAYFERNSYPVRVWYAQIYPDRYGIVFNSKKVEGKCSDKKQMTSTQIAPKPKASTLGKPVQKKITLTSTFLFNTNEYTLKPESFSELDAIIENIITTNPSTVIIAGHTDNVGLFDANLELSINRASAVSTYLKEKTRQISTKYIVRGMGDQAPISSNDTESGRQQNRRVEVVFQ